MRSAAISIIGSDTSRPTARALVDVRVAVAMLVGIGVRVAVGVLVVVGGLVAMGGVGVLVGSGDMPLGTEIDQMTLPYSVASWAAPALSAAVIPAPSSKRQLATSPAGATESSVWKFAWIWAELRVTFQMRMSSSLPCQ